MNLGYDLDHLLLHVVEQMRCVQNAWELIFFRSVAMYMATDHTYIYNAVFIARKRKQLNVATIIMCHLNRYTPQLKALYMFNF